MRCGGVRECDVYCVGRGTSEAGMACGACAGPNAMCAGERGSLERERGAERQAREGGRTAMSGQAGGPTTRELILVVDGTGEGNLKLVPELGVEHTGGRVVVTFG